jgi:hypothetical protein
VFGARRLLGQGPYPAAVLAGGWLTDHVVTPAVLLLVLGLAEAVVAVTLLSSGKIRALTGVRSAGTGQAAVT